MHPAKASRCGAFRAQVKIHLMPACPDAFAVFVDLITFLKVPLPRVLTAPESHRNISTISSRRLVPR